MTFSKQPLNRWLRQIEQSIADRRLLRDGQKILVAVSGGLDSMVLLHVLHLMAGAHQWKLTVAHFNHRLRGAAGDADERLVRRTARRLGWPVVAGRADVAQVARVAGVSLEMAGRKLRHDFLARTARKHRIPSIALAHHADDQVELFFLRLLRGASGRGLAGMRWSNPSPSDPSIALIRPLLDQTKDALREAAQSFGVKFSEDATNASLDIHRNRVRHELLPLLRKHYQPRLSERVLCLMEQVGAESEAAGEWAERWLAAKKRVNFDRLAVAVQRQVLYLQMLRLGQSPEFGLIEHLRAHAGEPVTVGPKQWLTRNADGLVRAGKIETPEFDAARVELVMTTTKGTVEFDGLALTWESIKVGTARRAVRTPQRGVPTMEYFDADKVGRKICLRHWQPGDRFQPIGMKSARKLQDLFTDLKVPRDQRHQRIVAATSRGEIFWVEGLRMAEGFKLGPGTVRRLKWQWKRGSLTR